MKSQQPLPWIQKYFHSIATLDHRAIAFFRINFGLVVLLTLFEKGAHLTAFFTDQGVMPRGLHIQYSGWWVTSLHMMNGSWGFQFFLFSLSALAAVSFIVGYRTRLSTIILWLMIVSMQNRNHLILHSGDALMRIMLFWSIFLPLGKQFSMDCFFQTKKIINSKFRGVASLASFLILMQMIYVYFFTALLKDHPEWHTNFLSVYYTLNLNQFTTAFGEYLLNFPELLKLATAGTYYLELIGPILLLLPFQKYLRAPVVLAFIGLHASLILTMNLGYFPWTCITIWSLFLPGSFWNFILPKNKKCIQWVEAVALKISHFLPQPPKPVVVKPIIITILLLFTFVCTTTWNFYTLPNRASQMSDQMRSYVRVLRLDQYWSMFSPYPMRTDGWFVAEGKLQDGSIVDPWNETDNIQWDRPKDFFPFYKAVPWRKYLTNVWLEKNLTPQRLAFGKYLCRNWNSLHGPMLADKRLASYTFYFMSELAMPPGVPQEVVKQPLWEHNCFEKPNTPIKK